MLCRDEVDRRILIGDGRVEKAFFSTILSILFTPQLFSAQLDLEIAFSLVMGRSLHSSLFDLAS